jgi:hypothetical protein
MNNEQWWAAERKAAEFWRKVKENQTAHGRNSLHRQSGVAPTAWNGAWQSGANKCHRDMLRMLRFVRLSAPRRAAGRPW